MRVFVSPTRSYFRSWRNRRSLGWSGGGQVADLVEEERPAFGGGHLAGGVADGAGEGALGVAEEVAFEQVGAEARAAHGDERAVGPLAPGVQGVGEDPLAGAVLAPEQDGGVARGDAAGELEDAADLGVAALQVGLGHLARGPGPPGRPRGREARGPAPPVRARRGPGRG